MTNLKPTKKQELQLKMKKPKLPSKAQLEQQSEYFYHKTRLKMRTFYKIIC